MSAVRQLWMQLWRRMPTLVVLANLLWLGALGMAVYSLRGEHDLIYISASLIGFGSWFWHLGQGQTLRGLCRPESFLLPYFRRRLLWLGALDVTQWVLLPALLAMALGVPHVTLIASCLVLVAAIGLATGGNRLASLMIWPFFVLAGWMPQLASQILRTAVDSLLTAPLLLLIAALILRLTLRPMLRIDDQEPDVSPLESTSLGRMNTRTSDGSPARRTALGKRIAALFDQTSQRAMDRALARYRHHPTALQRMVLVRRLLLPHDNPEGIALRLALVATFVTIYFFAITHRQHFNAVSVGAYAILLTMTRFPQLGMGMLRMRPNLADLYLTLAPQTRAEYQKTLADALLVLVPISVLTALAYTALGAVLVHAIAPERMLLTAVIVAAASSLVALGIHLIGPEGTFGRGVVNIVLIFGSMGVYWGGYWLLGAIGYAFGSGLLAVITLSFGIGVWLAAQHEYQRRPPCFDAPLG